jgi:chromosome segregation ATPase
MHIGKLNAELNMREESFERELKMANLNVTELVDRLRTLANEKDQTIRNLQEKIGFLESDINKKESIIRNLRDEASNRFSPPAATVYSSAVNPADHRVGEKEEVYKK